MNRPVEPDRAPTDPNVDVLDLLSVMETVYTTCNGKGAWRFRAVLFTVSFPDPRIVGSGGGRIYSAPVGREHELESALPGEFLTRFWGTSPRLRQDEPIWLFDSLASGPLTDRLKLVADTRGRRRAQDAVNAALVEAARRRERHEAAGQGLVGAAPWETCRICSPLAEDGSGTAPVRGWLLEILGAPLFHDRSDRGWCVKRCLSCRTHYLWKSAYEYLVNGATEDEESLTRLSDDEAREWVRKVEEAVRPGRVP